MLPIITGHEGDLIKIQTAGSRGLGDYGIVFEKMDGSSKSCTRIVDDEDLQLPGSKGF